MITLTKLTLPLYSATLEGKAYDNGTEYEMVIITKWSDRTENATEVGRKVFYFDSSRSYLDNNKTKESWCEWFYNNYKDRHRFMIEEV